MWRDWMFHGVMDNVTPNTPRFAETDRQSVCRCFGLWNLTAFLEGPGMFCFGVFNTNRYWFYSPVHTDYTTHPCKTSQINEVFSNC